MSIKNLLDTTKNELEIEFKFVYITYDKEETLTNDDTIKDIQIDEGTKKFIEINVSKVYKDEFKQFLGISPFLITEDSIYENINENFLESLSNRSLSNEEISLFNTPDVMDGNTKYIHEDIQEKNIDDTLNYFNTRQIEEIKDFLKSSKKLKTCLEYENNISKIKNKNIFSNRRVFDNIKTYNKLFKTNNISSTINVKNNPVSFILTNFNTTGNEITERVFIGYLVKKYKKNTNENYDFISSSFFNKKIQRNNSDTRLTNYTHNISIKDEAVKYGDVYKYVIYPVYYYFAWNDSIKTGYFICDFPSITTDITCEESLRPPPPVNISGLYSKHNKTFYLNWSLPVNDQQDIKGFQIFKRNSIDEPYRLVKQIENHSEIDFYERNVNIDNNDLILDRKRLILEYEDNTFDPSKINIYTICSIDAHGLVSNYSSQIAYLYNFLENKTNSDLVSYPGAPLFYPNLLIPKKTIFIDNDDKLVTTTPIVSKKNKFTLMATPDCFKYNDINDDEGPNIDLFKSEVNSYYKLSLFRSNNRSIFEDKIRVVNYDEN
tara:strand:+ start:10023 stop:11663 length:1641 start_codon:yes stop_codon:yes gene_type:complete